MRLILLVLLAFLVQPTYSQNFDNPLAKKWADSVYKTFNNDERIGQLMVTRLSSIDPKTRKVTFFYDRVLDYIKKYNIGSVCLFQGSPVLQATYLNSLKMVAKTPILFSIDGEWGVGMRLTDSILPLPKQMMLGAMSDPSIVYQYGKIVANQCKRLGIQTNYAPVMDVNNNPNNPVINDRSFGEDKFKVANFGIQYMKGMQDNGVLACAKHFPGHGDVTVDSHSDLPVIYKAMAQLDSIELYPFKQIFKEGIGSVMIGHLSIPAIDDRANRPTSLSNKNIEGLLRTTINYQGLTVTDGLEMQGVKKFFPDGEASVESLIAGNDLLCLPDSIPLAIEKVKKAIKEKRLSWKEIEKHCKRVLMTKYKYVLPENNLIPLDNLTQDLNKDVLDMRALVATNAITLLANQDDTFFPLTTTENKGSVAYVAVGIKTDNAFASRMRSDYNAGVFYFDFTKKSKDSINTLLDQIVLGYRRVVIGIHQINRAPANNFGMSEDAVQFVNTLQQRARAYTFLFGNAYAIKNWCFAKNLSVCYEDNSTVHNVAIDMLEGKLPYKGTLPVSVCENFKYGFGIQSFSPSLPKSSSSVVGLDSLKLTSIDSIVEDAITKKAMPGCVVAVVKDGKLIMEKAYGSYTYSNDEKVTSSSIYDLASLTKILSTTLCIMKLYEEGKIDFKKTLGDYLSSVKGTNKENIPLEKLLLHEAGLKPYIPFYKETMDADGLPKKNIFSNYKTDSFANRVANRLFIRNDIIDTFYKRVLESPIQQSGTYVYSDNDFILLGKVVESVSGLSLDHYVQKNFYHLMQLESMGYKPINTIAFNRIVPTEKETNFRAQQLRGDVHDPGAAIMGGVAGHAGLFGDAHDVACIMQMLLNGGELNGTRYLKEETVHLFTAYHSNTSRRGYGFDKPEKDNATRIEPYPAPSVSPETFGHTGFTGTCAWADPVNHIAFVFLSNRIQPTENNIFKGLNIRSKIQEAIYQSIVK